MKRAIVLAHYDRDGMVDPYVVAALAAYRRVCDTLVFVTVSARSIPREVDSLVDRAVIRENIGYDFGSWKAGLEALGRPEDFDEVVCVNDSVYGPLFDIAGALNSATACQADYWGMVLSGMNCWHVQSWFFAMRATLLRSAQFAEFWRNAGDELPKEDVILRREIGLSETAFRGGYAVAGVYDARVSPPVAWQDIADHVSLAEPARTWRLIRRTRPRRGHLNPSELLYRRLWAAGIPFLKRRVLHTNHYGLDLKRVEADLERLSPEWHALIAAHGHRTGENAWQQRDEPLP
jgi:hypothetical protein